jgi:hypothetical protein
VVEHAGDRAPLVDLPAFARFQADLRGRCDELPVVTGLERIGSFRLFEGAS